MVRDDLEFLHALRVRRYQPSCRDHPLYHILSHSRPPHALRPLHELRDCHLPRFHGVQQPEHLRGVAVVRKIERLQLLLHLGVMEHLAEFVESDGRPGLGIVTLIQHLKHAAKGAKHENMYPLLLLLQLQLIVQGGLEGVIHDDPHYHVQQAKSGNELEQDEECEHRWIALNHRSSQRFAPAVHGDHLPHTVHAPVHRPVKLGTFVKPIRLSHAVGVVALPANKDGSKNR
mmetsp:Transcript_12855/g.32084  ORF Transcript_12855/g.32084 Transcript_12855/m.32084 type:complete len:230 (+) Transcript_12855:549-1238(+)